MNTEVVITNITEQWKIHIFFHNTLFELLESDVLWGVLIRCAIHLVNLFTYACRQSNVINVIISCRNKYLSTFMNCYRNSLHFSILCVVYVGHWRKWSGPFWTRMPDIRRSATTDKNRFRVVQIDQRPITSKPAVHLFWDHKGVTDLTSRTETDLIQRTVTDHIPKTATDLFSRTATDRIHHHHHRRTIQGMVVDRDSPVHLTSMGPVRVIPASIHRRILFCRHSVPSHNTTT